MLLVLVVDALLIGKNVRVITQKKLGSCHGTMVKNIRKKRRHTIKDILRKVECENCGCKVKTYGFAACSSKFR